MKNIMLILMSIIIFMMIIGCSNPVESTGTTGPPQYEGKTFVIDPGDSEGRNYNPPEGDRIYASIKGKVYNPTTGHTEDMYANSGDWIYVGTVGPNSPLSSMRLSMLLLPGAENLQSCSIVKFHAIDSLDCEHEFGTPTLSVVDVATGQVDTTIVLDKIIQPLDETFSHGYPKAYSNGHGFGMNTNRHFYTIGTPMSERVQATFRWTGIGLQTYVDGVLTNIAVSELPMYSEVIHSGMDIRIICSLSDYRQRQMLWNPNSQSYEITLWVLPNSYFNCAVFEAGQQANMKLYGLKVGNGTEMMNIYPFYDEWLFTGQFIGAILHNVDDEDLRGVWGDVGPTVHLPDPTELMTYKYNRTFVQEEQ
jgi:hypothetical protein